MSLTVSQLMELPCLRRAKVLAGKKGLNRIVATISVLEYATPTAMQKKLYDSIEFWGSELVITGFCNVADDVEAQCENIRKLAASLEKKGLVKILKNPRDGRACVIRPTETLAQYFQQAAQLHTQKLTDLFSVYSDQEMEQLFWLLMKLYTGIERLEQPQREEEKI